MKREETGRLIVVDDEPKVTTSLCNILSEVGYQVEGYTSGKNALEALEKKSFDLLLTDLDMPEMNGLELLRLALKRDRNLLSLIITGKNTEQTMISALSTGAFDVITKPFRFDVLRMKISRALEVSRLRRGEDILRCVFENSVEGIYLMTSSKCSILCNKTMARIFGYESSDELTADMTALNYRYVSPERRERLMSLLQKRDIVSGFESQVFRKDSSTIWISEDIQTVRDAENNVICYRGTIRDINGKKREEETLLENERNLRLWAEKAERCKELCLEVIDDICYTYTTLEENLVCFLAALSNAIDGRSAWMRGHSQKVADYAIKIAHEMRLEDAEIRNIRLAALCHDIGKLNLDDSLICKTSQLTEEEYEIIKQHPVLGVTLLQSIGYFSDIIPLIRHHHERVDGYGYPDGLKADEIPIGAKILHVAESFDSMTAERPYRPALGKKYALLELKKGNGIQFDPRVAKAALKALSD